MTDLAAYERRGDIDGPFTLTTKHNQAQLQSERIREAVRCDVPPLTFDEYRDGRPCPGCGRPYLDQEGWEFKGRWRLRLYCGHVVEKRAHHTHKTLHSAFTGSFSCAECGLDPATIIDAEAIGLAGDAPTPRPASQPAQSWRPGSAPWKPKSNNCDQSEYAKLDPRGALSKPRDDVTAESAGLP